MKILSLFVLFLPLIFTSCNSSSQQTEEQPAAAEEQQVSADSIPGESATVVAGEIDKITAGMSEKEVIAMIGEPTSVQTLNNDPEKKVEDWWYGDNQKIRFVKSSVNRIVYNDKKERELMKEILEARQKGDNEKAQELMNRLRDGVR